MKYTPQVRDFLSIATTLILVGASWGALSSRMESLEDRMDSYESQTLMLLEELRKDTAELKVAQAEIARDVEWIKLKINGTSE